jgi:HK97 family phage portal protein
VGMFATALRAQPVTSARNPAYWLQKLLGAEGTAAGIAVNPERAMRVLGIYAAIRLISEDVGRLPFITYRRLERGKDRDRAHPVYRILHDTPNPEMTAITFRESLTGQVLASGNAYAEIERDQVGRIKALWPLRWDRMQVLRDRQTQELVYRYTLPNGQQKDFARDRIFHLRGFGGDGIMGYSPIGQAREEIAGIIATREWRNRFYSNDATPGGALTHPGELSDTARTNIEASWNEAHRGLSNSHRVAILEEGVSYTKIGIDPKDLEFAETQRLDTEQVARLFRLAPPKLSDYSHATYTNIEEANIDHVVSTLDSWFVRWEQQANKDLLPTTHFCEHLREHLMKGRLLDRYRAYAIAMLTGWKSADDIRDHDNENPLPDGQGQQYLVPQNMAPADLLRDLLLGKDKDDKPASEPSDDESEEDEE